VDRARIFIVEPRAGAGEQAPADAGKGRVIFSLQ
jgi:hypothetical protein